MGNLSKLFTALLSSSKNLAKLVSGSSGAAGHRIFPSKTPRNDDTIGFRIDQGAMQKDGTYKVTIQQNGVPHGKTLASTTVDLTVDSGRDVFNRLITDAKANGHKVDES
jgi:hypothetical protein